jgi:hypothetical protein
MIMVKRSKDIGTRHETAFARHAREHGFPDAERRALAGNGDLGDILLCRNPTVIVEIKGGAAAKAAGAGAVTRWLAETEAERRNAQADVGLLVVQRTNPTVPGPAGWQAWLPLHITVALAVEDTRMRVQNLPGAEVALTPVALSAGHALRLLRWAGYGEPLPPETEQALVGAGTGSR